MNDKKKRKPQNNVFEGRPYLWICSFILHFRHLTCFLMNALIGVMRNCFSYNMLQIIAFSFYSYSLLVMAFHRYFFPSGSDCFTTMENSFCCIPITFYDLLFSVQVVCPSYISDSLIWNADKLTPGLCRPE